MHRRGEWLGNFSLVAGLDVLSQLLHKLDNVCVVFFEFFELSEFGQLCHHIIVLLADVIKTISLCHRNL